jgi:Phosphotransferase enzyme family
MVLPEPQPQLVPDSSAFTRGVAVARQVIPLARVTAYALAESVRRPTARSAADIPVDHRGITPEWLTAALCRDHPGVSVTSFVAEPAPGGTSTRWRVTVSYDAEPQSRGLPTHLFAKTTRDLRQRVLMGVSETLSGEPTFFSNLRRELPIQAPDGYFGAWDAASWRSIVLMEDVVETRGATFLSAADPVTKAQLTDLLANMATWHGHMWQDPRLVDLANPADIGRVFAAYTDMQARYRAGTARAGAAIPAELVGRHTELHERLKAALAKASADPQTMVHGDAHIGNTYMTASGAMGYGDWQVVRSGSWAFDFAMTVITGTEIADRRVWERELLAGYLDRLVAAGGPRVDREHAFQLYREQSVYPYLAWLTTLGRSVFQPAMQPDDLCRTVIARAAAAVCDLQ